MNNKITDISKELIEQKSQALGSEINYQLKQARLKALDNPKAAQRTFFRAWFIPATAATALAFYFMTPLLTIQDPGKTESMESYVDASDIELIEQLELVENLEFYEWLSQEEEMSSI